MIYLLLRENALTKRIASGVLSRASIIRAGKAGMVPSNRRQLTGFMKGNKNMAKKLGIKFEKSENPRGYHSTQLYDKKNKKIHRIIGLGNQGFDKKPITPSEHALTIRHELDEAKLRKNQKGIRKNFSIRSHASHEVLRREKQNVDKFKNMNPNRKTKRAVSNFYNYRTKSGEYKNFTDPTYPLRTHSQTKRFDNAVIRYKIQQEIDELQHWVNQEQKFFKKHGVYYNPEQLKKDKQKLYKLKKRLKSKILKRPTHHGS